MKSSLNLLIIGKVLLDIFLINIAFGFTNLIIFSSFWVDGWSYPFLFIVINILTIFLHFFTNQDTIITQLKYKYYKKSILYYLLYFVLLTSLVWLLVFAKKYFLIHLLIFFFFTTVLWISARYLLYELVSFTSSKILPHKNYILLSIDRHNQLTKSLEKLNFHLIHSSSEHKINIDYYKNVKNTTYAFSSEKLDIKTDIRKIIIYDSFKNNHKSFCKKLFRSLNEYTLIEY